MQIDVPLQLTVTTPEPLETRKLAYVHLPNGAQPRSQSSVSLFNFFILYMAQCDRSFSCPSLFPFIYF